ncbi:MAG: carboxypeptidase-like regulatory domain-containing protein, partial [Alistipes sp.]|nr:carboxypeptidase-like regulatory domain-containing protein [Alistipes sp.]
MKHFLTLILGLLVGLTPLAAAQQEPLSGRVLEENGEPVAFATVVLLRGEEQVAGLATDDAGRFSLVAPAGEYTLQISYLGYETWTRPVVLPTVLEEIRLQPTATRIEGVEVTAQLIRREADRFIVDVANSPVAVGKDGTELLKTAPGVWVTDEQISINGSRGARVYVNDRELKLSGEQLLHYLRSLHAEQIARIEVIPLSGADYDADSSAGIIRITLKRQREDGLMGSVGYSFTGGEHTLTHAPNLNLDYNSNRLNLYA